MPFVLQGGPWKSWDTEVTFSTTISIHTPPHFCQHQHTAVAAPSSQPCAMVAATLARPASADLQRDAYPVLSNERPTRCTGTALQVAEALMAASVPPGSCAARIMLFTGGPCTEGMGKIINKDLAEEIRR